MGRKNRDAARERHERPDEVILVGLICGVASLMHIKGNQLGNIVRLPYRRRKELLHDEMIDIRRRSEWVSAEITQLGHQPVVQAARL